MRVGHWLHTRPPVFVQHNTRALATHCELWDMAASSSANEPSAKGSFEAEGLPPVAPDVIEQDYPETIDNVVPTRGYQMLPMVGLGGSAGGITALQGFFKAMPADSGMVFVVIMHLSPTHESTLADLLSRTTKMKVVQGFLRTNAACCG